MPEYDPRGGSATPSQKPLFSVAGGSRRHTANNCGDCRNRSLQVPFGAPLHHDKPGELPVTSLMCIQMSSVDGKHKTPLQEREGRRERERERRRERERERGRERGRESQKGRNRGTEGGEM